MDTRARHLGRRRGVALLAALAMILSLSASMAAASAVAAVYVGKGAGGRVEVKLTGSGESWRATIALSRGLAGRVAEHSVRLSCGLGNYGGQPLVSVRWPSGKRVLDLGSRPVPGGVDRCRLQSGGRLRVQMQMHAGR